MDGYQEIPALTGSALHFNQTISPSPLIYSHSTRSSSGGCFTKIWKFPPPLPPLFRTQNICLHTVPLATLTFLLNICERKVSTTFNTYRDWIEWPIPDFRLKNWDPISDSQGRPSSVYLYSSAIWAMYINIKIPKLLNQTTYLRRVRTCCSFPASV